MNSPSPDGPAWLRSLAERFPVRDWRHHPDRTLARWVVTLGRTDSTNARLLELVGQADSDGIVLLADEQTAGRGQHGRSWIAAPRSSVLLSLLFHPPADLRQPALLTAWAAVSVCSVVQAATGRLPRIKWPNDVLIDERKVCGILIEQTQVGNACVTVVGIGLNVTQPRTAFEEAGLPLATSLTASGATWTVDETIDHLLDALEEWYDRLLGSDRGALEASWKWHLGHLGERVALETPGGIHQGRLVEIAFDGLVLERPGRQSVVLKPESILHIHRAG